MRDLTSFLYTPYEKSIMKCPYHGVTFREFDGFFGRYFACPKRVDGARCKMRPSNKIKSLIQERMKHYGNE